MFVAAASSAFRRAAVMPAAVPAAKLFAPTVCQFSTAVPVASGCSRSTAAAVPSWGGAGCAAPVSVHGRVHRRTFLNVFSNIKQSMTQGFQDKKLEKQRELTLWQLNHVSSLPSYGMRDHVTMLKTMTDKAGVNNLMTNVLTAMSKEQKAAMDEQTIGLRIAEQLTPEEVEKPSHIRSREKMRIAAAVGCDLAKVNSFVQGFEMTRQMNEWINGRRARGLPLPSTLEEYSALVQQDRVGMSGQVQKRQLKDSLRRGGLRAVLRKEAAGVHS